MEEYIAQLETLVCFYASAYNACEQRFHTKHLRTCASNNPERRDLTDEEFAQIMQFPQIQGFQAQRMARRLAELHDARLVTPENVREALR